MSFRNTLLLFLLLVGFATYIYFFENPWESSKGEEDRIFDFSADQVAAIRLFPRGEPFIELRREEGGWKITNPIEVEGDSSAIDSIVSTLSRLRSDRVVEESPANLSAYGLEEPEIRAQAILESGEVYEIWVGKKSPIGNKVYVKRADQPMTWTVRGTVRHTLGKSLFDLREKRILRIDWDTLKEISWRSALSVRPTVVQKRGEEWFLQEPEEGFADAKKVQSLLNRLKGLRASQFIEEGGEDYGFNRPRWNIRLQTGGETPSVTLLIGKSAGEEKSYAKVEGEETIFVAPSKIVKDLSQPVEDFVEHHALPFQQWQVNQVEVLDPSGSVQLIKEEGEWWDSKDLDREVEEETVSEFFSTLRDVRIQDFVAEKEGNLARYRLENPSLEIRIGEGEEERVLRVGGLNEEGEAYFAMNRREPRIFLISKEDIDLLHDKVEGLRNPERTEES